MSAMNRKDLIPVVILITLLFLWGPLSRILVPPPPPSETPPEAPERTPLPPAELTVPAPDTPRPADIEADDDPVDAPDVEPEPSREPEPPRVRRPEQQTVLRNDYAEYVLSSWGAGIRHARLLEYRSTLDPESDPVLLDFEDTPALSYRRIPGISQDYDFEILMQSGDQVHFKAETAQELIVIREFSIDPENPYRFLVRDVFENTGAEALTIDDHNIQLGPFAPETVASKPSRVAGPDLGLDALPSGGGQQVRHWSRKRFMSKDPSLADLFYPDGYRGGGCSPFGRRLPAQLPASVDHRVPYDTDWIAVKNKFFVQILEPQRGAQGYQFTVDRKVPDQAMPGQPNTWSTAALPNRVAAALDLHGFELQPGETFERNYSYFAGPKQYSRLHLLGNHQEKVMEFGRLRFFCRILLRGLNGLYAAIPNYGIAVMLLTILIRILFWPVTRKSTESMKRMQELQPEMKALRERYKDNPQKMQQETMALYKKHKVNPVAGCLPMLIQIPVFFALFTVLRSAVELRFAEFLWIRDLSEPENLLAGMVPLVGSLNILPILMTLTMVWQQHLTPSAGDPNQRKMMMFMPVMMLVFFYSMPAALVLYWTTNQCLMIAQLSWQKKHKSPGASPTAPATSGPAKPAPKKPAPPPARRKRKR